jgi:hypothetical protein
MVAGYAHFMAAGIVSWWIAAACIAGALVIQPILDLIKGRGRKETGNRD